MPSNRASTGVVGQPLCHVPASFWDTLTAAYLGMPSLFSFQSTSLNIDVNPQSPTFGQFVVGTGFPVNLCTTFASGQTATTFYEYLAKQLASLTTV